MAVNHDLGLALKAKLLRGFADPSQLAMIEVLRAGGHTVSDMVLHTGLSQPNVSGHLTCLKDCGRFCCGCVGKRSEKCFTPGIWMCAEWQRGLDRLR